VEFAVISQRGGKVVFDGYSDEAVEKMLKEETAVTA
jgi:hypothetical protein